MSRDPPSLLGNVLTPGDEGFRTVLPVPNSTPLDLARPGSSVAASAKDVKIGETSVSLIAPSGQCELREDQGGEVEFIKGIQDLMPEIDLLASYADCRKLVDYRSGKKSVPDEMAYYAIMKIATNVTFPSPPDAVKQFCDGFHKDGKQILADASRGYLPRLKEALKGMKVGDPQFLGVLAEDATACYTATLQKIETDVTVTLMAGLVVRGKLLSYYLLTPYVGNATVPALLAKHKNNVAALLRANN